MKAAVGQQHNTGPDSRCCVTLLSIPAQPSATGSRRNFINLKEYFPCRVNFISRSSLRINRTTASAPSPVVSH